MTEERKNEIWAMLPCNYQTYVKRWYQDVIDNNEPHEHIFEGLFGQHNLTAQAEEKPKEPRFKVGDKVIAGYSLRIVLKINQVENIYRYFITDINGEAVWYDEDELALYTEPKEDATTSDENGQNSLDVAESVETGTFKDGKLIIPIKTEFNDSVYAAYRLDLAKEIAVAMIHVFNQAYQDIPEDAVTITNEIVKRLKETDNAN